MRHQTIDQAAASATVALDYESTMIGALELSSMKWVFAVQLPGSRKYTRHVVEPNGPALETLLEKLKANGALSGRPISRVIMTHEAGRDGFWLARFLQRRGIEVHVMQASSLPVDRRVRRAKTDLIDAEKMPERGMPNRPAFEFCDVFSVGSRRKPNSQGKARNLPALQTLRISVGRSRAASSSQLASSQRLCSSLPPAIVHLAPAIFANIASPHSQFKYSTAGRVSYLNISLI